MAVTSVPMMESLARSIFTGEALFAYPVTSILLTKIYVPFAWQTEAGKLLPECATSDLLNPIKAYAD